MLRSYSAAERDGLADPDGIIRYAKRGKPEPMGYADDELYRRRDAHLKAG